MRVQRDNSKDTITVYTSCTRKLDWILDSECSDHIVNDVWPASAIRKKKLKKEGKRDSLMRVGYVTWTSITRKSPGNAGRICNCGTCTREKSGAILMGPYVLRNCVNGRDSIAQTCLSLL